MCCPAFGYLVRVAMEKRGSIKKSIMQVQLLTWQLSVEYITPTAEALAKKYDAIADKWQQKILWLGYDRVYAT